MGNEHKTLVAQPAGEVALALRGQIQGLESLLSTVSGAVFGDSVLCPLTHRFAPGVYMREIFIPAGTLLTGKIHRYAHLNFIMQGEVIVITEQGGREHLVAPMAMVSPAGTKRAVLALEDTVWITVHATTLTDPDAIETEIIVPDYAALQEGERVCLL